MAVPRPPTGGRPAAGALVLALARWEKPNRDLRPFVWGLEPRRGAVRGLPVDAPAGGPFSLWGKVFDATIPIFLFLCVFSCDSLSHVRSFFFRLKRTLEQAQPSMAKRLRVGVASKDSG